jgi:hypothetical protein
MITRLSRLRYLRIAGFAAGSVVVAGAAFLVTASASGMNIGFKPAAANQTLAAAASPSPSKSAKAADLCNAFMTHLAKDVGLKNTADLNAAIQKAIGETLADQVSQGAISQTQADTLKKQLASQQACALAGKLGTGHHVDKGRLGAYLKQYQSAAAAALGITDAELKTDLAKGQSLSEIAAAKNVKEADFRTKLIANLQKALDAAVTSNQLTTTQEQAIINRLKTGPLPLWDKKTHKGAPATASPATSA